jgi:hypothetical protein
MAIEPRRGCGYRKAGAIYLVGSGQGDPCCKMPIALHICPTCNQGIKQARGWQWIAPQAWLGTPCTANAAQSLFCPAASPEAFGDKVGLLWIGSQFYPTAGEFMREGRQLGISRRIRVVPREFELGKTWVFLAHPKVVASPEGLRPGIFHIFRPSAIEKIVTESESKDEEGWRRCAGKVSRPSWCLTTIPITRARSTTTAMFHKRRSILPKGNEQSQLLAERKEARHARNNEHASTQTCRHRSQRDRFCPVGRVWIHWPEHRLQRTNELDPNRDHGCYLRESRSRRVAGTVQSPRQGMR